MTYGFLSNENYEMLNSINITLALFQQDPQLEAKKKMLGRVYKNIGLRTHFNIADMPEVFGWLRIIFYTEELEHLKDKAYEALWLPMQEVRRIEIISSKF